MPPSASVDPGMGSTQSKRYREFLSRLRRAREGAGMTQAQAAAVLGKPQSFISRCETGERRVDVIEFEDFLRIYGARPRDLLRGLPD